MADFIGENLTGSRFERADLSGSEFVTTNLSGSRFRNIDLSGSVLRGIALVDAELNRRDPDRATMRPADAAGFREAWDIVERRNEEWEHHRFAGRDLAILEARS